MLDPGERPLLFGFITAALLTVFLRFVPADMNASYAARGIGLAVFGAAIAWLSYRTRDSGSVFRFFLGGVIGTLTAFFIGLNS